MRGKVSLCHVQAALSNKIRKVSTTQVLAAWDDPLDKVCNSIMF